MGYKVEFKFDKEKSIFFKVYSGDIYFDDFRSSWENAIKNNLISPGVKNFIIDYKDATIMFDHSRVKDIVIFYTKYNDIFSNSKIALIMVKPEHVIFPMMVESEGVNFMVKPFYTVEGALKWLG